MSKVYEMEVKTDAGWVRVSPSNQPPYRFERPWDAIKNLEVCYPDKILSSRLSSVDADMKFLSYRLSEVRVVELDLDQDGKITHYLYPSYDLCGCKCWNAVIP